MGTAVASLERCPAVPETPTDPELLVTELNHYATKLDVKARLQAYNVATQLITDHRAEENAHYYLLELNATESSISVRRFKSSELTEATREYAAAEATARSKKGVDAVLVSVESPAALRRAFPNYFADTTVFVSLMERALAPERKRLTRKKRKTNARGHTLLGTRRRRR